MIKISVCHMLASAGMLVGFASTIVAAGQQISVVHPIKTAGAMHGNAIRTDRGNHSFRGLNVAVGETSAPFDIELANDGDSPVTGLTAATHGDFVITGNGCSQPLSAGTGPASKCRISVAFRPTHPGPSVGDLTVSAPGVQAVTVPLDAGTPINFGTVASGVTSTQWLELATAGPLTGSVTGPFTMALQGPYTYGSIDGVNFDSSGTASSGTLFLGVQLQATTIGNFAGTVSLSDGSTYSVSAYASGDPQLSPGAVDFRDIALQSVSGEATFTLTTGPTSSVSINNIAVAAPFSETNNCGSSLPADSTCSIQVIFTPTATGQSTGQLAISTSAGDVVSSLMGYGVPNIENVAIVPSSMFLDYGGFGTLSPPQTITVTNRNLSQAVSVEFGGVSVCTASLTSNCFQQLSNNCSSVAPAAYCQIQVQYHFGLPQGIFKSNNEFVVDRGNSGAVYSFIYQVNSDKSLGNSGLVMWPDRAASFPPTAVGEISDEQLATLTNTSTAPLFVSNVYFMFPNEFSFDSACGVLAPGASCTVHGRFMPIGSGAKSGDGGARGLPLSFTSGQYGDAAFSVQGYGIPSTTLASPTYPPLVQPVFFGGPVPDVTLVPFSLPIKNTGSAPLVISNVAEAPGSAGAVFAVDPTQCASPLAPGGECTLNLTWDAAGCPPGGPPFSECWDSATLYVESNADSSPEGYFLAGRHISTGQTYPALSPPPSPVPHYFGRVQVGESASMSFGFDPSKTPTPSPIPAVSVSGTGYQLNNGCAGFVGSKTASCTVTISFAPSTPGFQAGTVKWLSTERLTTETLSGTGIPFQLQVSPAVVNFPSTLVYQSPPPQIVTLTNVSAAPLALGATYVGNNVFQISASTCGDSLAAGASCTFTVNFTPYNIIGWSSSSINFSFGIDDGLENVSVNGYATSLAFSPASAAFGTINLGTTASRTFTVENIGAAATPYGQGYSTAIIQGTAITGINASDFVITANTCVSGATLSGTETCSVSVQFAPSAAGARDAVLTVTSSNAGVASANLTGTGSSPSRGCDSHPRNKKHERRDRRDCDCYSDHHKPNHERDHRCRPH